MTLPPGPSAPPLLQTWAWIRRPLRLLATCARDFGPTFTLRVVGGRTFVVVSHPDDVRAVFTGGDLFLGGAANKNFARFMGPHTLFALDGEPHARHRRLLLPAFHGERMRAYGPLLVDLTRAEVAGWPVGRAFPLLAAMRRITLDAIFQGVFGVLDPERRGALARLVARITSKASALLAFLPFLHVDLGPWSPWGAFVRARAELDRLLFDQIARARAGQGGEDILSRLVATSGEDASRAGEPFTDEELRDELLTLLFAGHETTATALAWTFRWLLGDPAWLARATAEARGAHDLERLPVLEAVCQEALRLSPPIPIVLRVLARDARVAGFDLPAGAHVVPSIWLAQRRPEAFPDPERFDPGRFLGQEERGRTSAKTPWSLFPFGGGPRICIGRTFSLYEMKVVLATTLARCDLRLVGAPSAAASRQAIVLVPRDGTQVVLERRT